MFSSVEFVRTLCKQRGIAISQLEKDCGFSNGYLNPKKMSRLPYDRAVQIAEYLDVDPTVVRVLYFVLSFFSAAFPGLLLYLCLTLLIPNQLQA
jgi:phage shock protein PspC (stress-responsive transcriptional regulator)